MVRCLVPKATKERWTWAGNKGQLNAFLRRGNCKGWNVNKKTPGLDGISYKALKLTVEHYSQLLLFCERWKIAWLVLIRKIREPRTIIFLSATTDVRHAWVILRETNTNETLRSSCKCWRFISKAVWFQNCQKRISLTFPLKLGEADIVNKTTAKYLSVIIDN